MCNVFTHRYIYFAENLKTMSKINFLPWVGEHYSTTGFAGKRILALGESHYCDKASDAKPDITGKVIADLFDPQSEHEAYKNTYTKFAEALLGRDCLSLEDKERFWNSIAFYNYVQVPMTGARVAPSQKDFRDSEAAFFEVLELLRPDIVIVWGSRLYNNLPHGGLQGDDLRAPDGHWVETWRYFLGDRKEVKIVPIMHPSSSFSPDYWHQFLSTII